MTPDEAIQYAKALKPGEDRLQEMFDRLDVVREVLTALEATASPATLKKTLKALCEKAEAFRRASAPGHATWYEHHLRAAAFAAERWAPIFVQQQLFGGRLRPAQSNETP